MRLKHRRASYVVTGISVGSKPVPDSPFAPSCLGPEDDEEGESDHGQGCVSAPRCAAADLVLIEGRLLAAWKHSSIIQRDPAIRTSSAGVVPVGQQM